MKYKINGFLLSSELDSAVRGEEIIELTLQEQKVLTLFFKSADGFVETKEIESLVWGGRVVTQNSIRKLISGLRLKFDDRNSFKNIRGKGYQLNFKVKNEKHLNITLKRSAVPLIILSATLLILALIKLKPNLFTSKKENALPKVSKQTVFESSDNILDYATHDGVLYVTARDKKSSKIYKSLNRKKTVLLTADFPGAYRGIEISESGRTLLHVIEDSKCKIKVFERPVINQIDEIPCNRQNAYPSFDWIDNTKFYVTFNVNPSSSIKPYIYNLETRDLEEVVETNFDSDNGEKFIDAFIKAHGNGIFSLRENHLDQMSLMYFEGSKRKTLYRYRAKPYSVAVSKNELYLVGNNNELLRIDLTDDILSQEISTSLFLAPQATKIDDPLILEDELYFSLGNTPKEAIYSTSGKFTYSLENGIRDFTYNEGVLSVLALTNTGYVVEQLKGESVFNSVYFDTKLSFRHIAFHKGDIYLAGASGIYKLIENYPKLVSELKIIELVSNGKCMIAEAENGIFMLDQNISSFKKIASQGERVFSSKKDCLYVDNLTGTIVNEKRKEVTKPMMSKLLFVHQGKIAHWHSVGDVTHIVDVETGNLIAKTKERALYKRVVSYEDDILYLGQAAVHTSIVKVRPL